MIAKVHASILHIHGLVGEKEASKWLTDSPKTTVSVSQQVKTPQKKTGTKRKATAASNDDLIAVAAAAEEGSSSGTERELVRDLMKVQYVRLLEMDELIREKLFILQVTN
jgi:hypothetical protein